MGKILKKIFAKTSFYFMSKGLDILLKNDAEVKERLSDIAVGTKIKLSILGQKEKLILTKTNDGFTVSKSEESINLEITFKFFWSLPKIVFGKSSVTDCYLGDEFFVKGELRFAVAMVFALEKFMAYILSNKMYKKIYGKVPQNSLKKSKMFAKLLFARRSIQ